MPGFAVASSTGPTELFSGANTNVGFILSCFLPQLFEWFAPTYASQDELTTGISWEDIRPGQTIDVTVGEALQTYTISRKSETTLTLKDSDEVSYILKIQHLHPSPMQEISAFEEAKGTNQASILLRGIGIHCPEVTICSVGPEGLVGTIAEKIHHFKNVNMCSSNRWEHTALQTWYNDNLLLLATLGKDFHPQNLGMVGGNKPTIIDPDAIFDFSIDKTSAGSNLALRNLMHGYLRQELQKQHNIAEFNRLVPYATNVGNILTSFRKLSDLYQNNTLLETIKSSMDPLYFMEWKHRLESLYDFFQPIELELKALNPTQLWHTSSIFEQEFCPRMLGMTAKEYFDHHYPLPQTQTDHSELDKGERKAHREL